MSSYKPVNAVLRGLEVLRVVNRTMPASVKEIHYETGFDKATIVRMLETLMAAGYVTREATSGGYSVTSRVLQLSSGFSEHDRASELCGPILSRFRRAVGWPSDFSVRDAELMIVVQTTRTDGPMFFNRRPGFRAPILTTSLGKVYLAHCSEAERQEILELLTPPPGERSPIPRNLPAMLEEIRAQGYATMEDSYSQSQYNGSITALAVPVFDDSRIRGAINIMLLREAVTPEEAVQRYLPGLRETAAEIGAAFQADAR